MVLTYCRGSVAHSFTDSDVLSSVPRPNRRTTTRPSTPPNFIPTSNEFNVNLISINEEANPNLFQPPALSFPNHSNPQTYFKSVGIDQELNPNPRQERHALYGEFDARNFLWANEAFNGPTSSLNTESPSVSLLASPHIAIAPTTDITPDHTLNPAVNSLPQQATTQSSHLSSDQNATLQSPRYICGINGCTKSYKRRSDLQRHQLHHSPSRNYACRFSGCKRAGQNGFKRRDHLKQHLRKVHGASQ